MHRENSCFKFLSIFCHLAKWQDFFYLISMGNSMTNMNLFSTGQLPLKAGCSCQLFDKIGPLWSPHNLSQYHIVRYNYTLIRTSSTTSLTLWFTEGLLQLHLSSTHTNWRMPLVRWNVYDTVLDVYTVLMYTLSNYTILKSILRVPKRCGLQWTFHGV